ncbi:MAG: GNAT family N-acetyltransferase [Chloroflexi bacterium]|nr:GNAT family N-acetyltransferase [Chloroflexota bacterium]MCY3581663.1 GNAT family N-acetyltransferase [Chloroflexota bacterium]MCY3717173.1 GNAT family N-acetyltransferase [Chloroflexota bacterium]MDE2650390.1 GNAT family N-acetyltransferase [Chloroflexota bacterium]MXV92269.1 GNAT family N-acetyltransferase [Chloroflexota bacterium]
MSAASARLVSPAAAYKASYIDAVCEYIREGHRDLWDPEILRANFAEYLQTLRDKESAPLAGMVPATLYWLILPGGIYAGELDLRHVLNEDLRRFGGHIGYSIRPSLRRRGYGRLICRLGIQAARARGIGDILITCDEDNIASRKIIEANGGELLDIINAGQRALTRRYWLRAAVSTAQAPEAQPAPPPMR